MTGWRLTTAEAISSDGTMIVGWGINPQGNTEAWIAIVPEPGMVGIAVLPILIPGRRRCNARI